MKKLIFNICAFGAGAVMGFAPLAGNAYYCSREMGDVPPVNAQQIQDKQNKENEKSDSSRNDSD